MKIKVKYLGILEEVCKTDEEEYTFSKNIKVSELLSEIYKRHSDMKKYNFQTATPNKIISKDDIISTNEIALLPPFSGG